MNLSANPKRFVELYAYGPNRGNGKMSYTEAYDLYLSKKGQ